MEDKTILLAWAITCTDLSGQTEAAYVVFTRGCEEAARSFFNRWTVDPPPSSGGFKVTRFPGADPAITGAAVIEGRLYPLEEITIGEPELPESRELRITQYGVIHYRAELAKVQQLLDEARDRMTEIEGLDIELNEEPGASPCCDRFFRNKVRSIIAPSLARARLARND